MDGFLGLADPGPSQGGEEHDRDDDERHGRGRDRLEERELGKEGVYRHGAGADGGDETVGFDAFGGQQMGRFHDGRRKNDQQQHEQADAADAVLMAESVAGGPLFGRMIKPEQAEQRGQHDRAEGETIAKGGFHDIATGSE